MDLHGIYKTTYKILQLFDEYSIKLMIIIVELCYVIVRQSFADKFFKNTWS